jgi:hypothetical protein
MQNRGKNDDPARGATREPVWRCKTPVGRATALICCQVEAPSDDLRRLHRKILQSNEKQLDFLLILNQLCKQQFYFLWSTSETRFLELSTTGTTHIVFQFEPKAKPKRVKWGSILRVIL